MTNGGHLARAANCRAWAIGVQKRNGFHVRKVVWGRLLARWEKREGETVRGAVIFLMVEAGAPR